MRKKALPLFYNKITQVFDQMSQESETAGLSYELIIVDDGSVDRTLDVAKELAVNDSGVKYISFSRNFGKRQPCMQACSMRWGICCNNGCRSSGSSGNASEDVSGP